MGATSKNRSESARVGDRARVNTPPLPVDLNPIPQLSPRFSPRQRCRVSACSCFAKKHRDDGFKCTVSKHQDGEPWFNEADVERMREMKDNKTKALDDEKLVTVQALGR